MALSPTPRGYSARDVFRSALGFDAACSRLSEIDHEKNPIEAALIGHSIISVSALSIELLLKTLHALHSENPIPGHHHLAKLYRGLGEIDRVAVQKRWLSVHKEWHEKYDQARKLSGVEGTTPRLVEAALEEGAKAFEQARYHFEPEAKRFTYYLDHLRKPLIDLIVELHPYFGVWTVTASHTPWDAQVRQTSPSP